MKFQDYLYKKNPEGANEIINKLESKYKQHIDELYSTEEYKQKTLEFVKSVFDYIRSYTKDIFTLFEEKVILGTGEIISIKHGDKLPLRIKEINAFFSLHWNICVQTRTANLT